MKITAKIIGLSILLFVLWIFNSYRNGDFTTESMAQMDARFPKLPETEFTGKQTPLEIDLEQYEKTVNGIHDTIRDRIQIQNHIFDNSQVELRPKYDTPRFTDQSHHERINPAPIPKIIR